MKLDQVIDLAKCYADQADSIKELFKAAIHTGQPIGRLRRHYKDKEFAGEIGNATRPELSNLFSFAKAFRSERGSIPMRKIDIRSTGNEKLSNKILHEKATKYSEQLVGANRGKLKRLSARVANSPDKYTAYAHIALFYPRLKKHQHIIRDLIGELEEIDLDSFKKLLTLTLVYFEAEL